MLKPVLDDWIKVGSMQVVSRFLGNGSLYDSQWQQETLGTLLGFTAYHLLVKNNVDTSRAGEYQHVVDDILKVGTVLLVSRLVAQKDMQDPAWLLKSLYTLIGFTVYNLVTKKMYDTGHFDPESKQIADDFIKFGTVNVVSHVLNTGSVQSLATPKFAQDTLNQFVGRTIGELNDYS